VGKDNAQQAEEQRKKNVAAKKSTTCQVAGDGRREVCIWSKKGRLGPGLNLEGKKERKGITFTRGYKPGSKTKGTSQRGKKARRYKGSGVVRNKKKS